MDPNDPFADLVPGGTSTAPRVGYIPGTPKAKDPLDIEGKTLDIESKRLGIQKTQKELASGGNATEAERTAAFLATRVSNGLNDINAAMQANPSEQKPSALASAVGGIFGNTARNYANSPARRQIEAAQLDVLDAALTLGTGAAYTPDQLSNYRTAYFPQLGDDDATVASKQRRLRVLLEAAKVKAGQSAPMIDKALAAIGGDQVQVSPQATEKGFDVQDTANQLTPDQAAKDKAFLATNPTPEQYTAFLSTLLNRPMDSEKTAERLKAVKEGGRYNPGIADPRIQQRIDEMNRTGSGAGSAAVGGFGDAASLGLIDEAGAGVNALGQSLSGQGSFGDLYNVDLQANRGYIRGLRENNPLAFLGGQFAGGAVLPVGEVTAPLDLAKVGAAYGGAYGAGSGESLGDRLTGGLTGAAAGGAIGYALPAAGALLRGRSPDVPAIVDPTTGALNQPLEAMRPGQRVAAANEFGINLPLDAAGGRTAAVIGKGMDIMPGSAGVMEDARRATEQQVAAAADQVASRFGSSRTLSEGGSELQRGALERIERGKDVISKAYNAIPISDSAAASNTNTVAALRELTGRFASNPELADAVKDPRLISYLNAIEKGGLSWRDLKDFRSLVGEKIGDMRFGEGHSTQDLRALYGALSEDMRNTAASLGPKASRAFDRANSLNRENQNLIEGALTRVLGPDGRLSPEKAASAVQAMTKGGKSTGDLKTLAQIRSATVKSGAWDEIASTLIRLGGQPVNSAGRDFNPQTFVNWYADMAQPARNLLFGQGELRAALDKFVAVNQRLTKVNALRNTSQTAGSMMAGSTVAALGATLMNPALGAKVLMIGAGNYGMAKVWTNPAFVRWATGFARASTDSAAKSQIGRLGKLAATNPNIREPLVALQQQLLKAANENVTRPLAASQPDESNQNQDAR